MCSVFSDEGAQQSSKKELIDTAKLIAISSQNVVKLATQVANQCPDRRLKQVRTFLFRCVVDSWHLLTDVLAVYIKTILIRAFILFVCLIDIHYFCLFLFVLW